MAMQEIEKEEARMDRELARSEIVDTTRRPSILGAAIALAAIIALVATFAMVG